MKIDDMDLSVRSKIYLEKLGYTKVEGIDLERVINTDMINFGAKTKKEIGDYLQENYHSCYVCKRITERVPNEDGLVTCKYCSEH